MSNQTQAMKTMAGTVGRPEDEWLGAGPSLLYGLQHILSMFGGLIAVPVLVGTAAGLSASDRTFLLGCTLFICGLATILQTVGVPFVGSQLPLVQGVSFAAVGTMIAIINSNGKGAAGLQAAYGATIVTSVIAFLMVPLFAQLVHFFPPVVTGSVMTIIGMSLVPACGTWITGNATITQNGQSVVNPNFGNTQALALALVTLMIVLGFTKIKRTSRFAILLGLLSGTIIALVTGFQKFTVTGAAFSLPELLYFGMPTFQVSAIVSMFIVMLVIMVGTEVDTKRVAAGLRADTLSSAVAPLFNTFPASAFAQNVGLVAMTGVKSRWVVAVGGGLVAVFGLSPALASIVNVIPLPVLGGVGICLFGSVAASGIRTLAKVKYDGTHNSTIVAVSLTFGLLPYLAPGFWDRVPPSVALVLDSGISSAAIVAILLNIYFNRLGSKDADVASSQAHAPVAPLVAEANPDDAPTFEELRVAFLPGAVDEAGSAER